MAGMELYWMAKVLAHTYFVSPSVESIRSNEMRSWAARNVQDSKLLRRSDIESDDMVEPRSTSNVMRIGDCLIK